MDFNGECKLSTEEGNKKPPVVPESNPTKPKGEIILEIIKLLALVLLF